MINTILLETHLVIDPAVLEVLMSILAIFLIYLFYFRIPIKMAKKRHRDPLGWVLLSFVISPFLTYIILLLVGDSN